MDKILTAYRFFAQDGNRLLSAHDMRTEWPRPAGKKPSPWKKYAGELAVCASGFHASDGIFAGLENAAGSVFTKVQVKGAIGKEHWQGGKLVASQLRIVTVYPEPVLRGLACLSALMSLQYFEKLCPGDARPRAAILLGLKVAAGEDVSAAAKDAAWDAAKDAAWAAAWDVASAAARAAAWAAAWDAASAAAKAAAWAAASAAAKDAFVVAFNGNATDYLKVYAKHGQRQAAFDLARVFLPVVPKEQEAVRA